MLPFRFVININHSFSKTNSSIDTWTKHVSSAQRPHVAGGCSILQHRPETSWKLRERAGNSQETQGPEERVKRHHEEAISGAGDMGTSARQMPACKTRVKTLQRQIQQTQCVRSIGILI